MGSIYVPVAATLDFVFARIGSRNLTVFILHHDLGAGRLRIHRINQMTIKEITPALCYTRSRQFAYSAVGSLILLCLLAAGCQSVLSPARSPIAQPAKSAAAAGDAFTLEVGDVLKISFPGTPSLDSTQSVRRDGKITMGMIGELSVVGRTPVSVEQELLKLYSTQLVSREVTVMVVSSSYAIFVSGAVMRPGKITVDRPLTALEAIMESGGFDEAKANLKEVKVIRQENDGTKSYVLNLKDALDGKASAPFYLRRSDIIYVPEKFSWF